MIYPSARYLAVVESQVHPRLISTAALAHIKKIAHVLPPVSGLILECRLGAAEEVDFIPQFMARDKAATFFANQSSCYRLPDPVVLTNPAWRQVQKFCTSWSQMELLNAEVPDIWLEFDVDRPPPRIPVPGLFVIYRSPPESTSVGTLRSKHYQATLIALETLLGVPLPCSLTEILFASFSRLPGKARIFAVGAMLPRPSRPIKICVSDILPEQIVPYLNDLGWPGCQEQVYNVITQVTPFLDELYLQIDIIDHQLSPTLGIECYLLERNPKKEPRWSIFLDYLVKTGHCLAEKRDALLTWYGGQLNILPNAAEPLQEEGPTSRSVILRQISHVKIVLHPDFSHQAKAYLHIDKGWLPSR